MHNVEYRLSRFLLMVQDSLGKTTLPLTQKSISLMLGVRRASVTEMAILLQKRQIIQYSRGKITILDRHQGKRKKIPTPEALDCKGIRDVRTLSKYS